jgi:hypothetical protein
MLNQPVMKFLLILLLCPAIALTQAKITEDSIYTVKATLTKTAPLPPYCGTIAWAVVQKFKIISSDMPGYKSRYILVAISCPEFLGKDFFQKNKVYRIELSRKTAIKNSVHYSDIYKKEDLPVYWGEKISVAD